MSNFRRNAVFYAAVIILQLINASNGDLPCKPFKPDDAQSVVCACDAEYCDQITRLIPYNGTFVSYISSESGLRFEKKAFLLRKYETLGNERCLPTNCNPTLELDPSTTFQTIEGFGGAVTDSAGINWDSLQDPRIKQHLIDSYFSAQGIEYNMIRLPVGGTDFSTRPYTYNDFEGDVDLTSFSLAYEDFKYKIPMINAAFESATDDVHIISSFWSPPVWMKTSNNITNGFIDEKYYQTFSNYLLKFIESYSDEGILIWAITTGNEPINNYGINGMEWKPAELGLWIEQYFGPTLRNSNFSDVKILAVDDQRYLITEFFSLPITFYPGALNYIDGIALHFYYDLTTPAAIVSRAVQDYPDIFVISTEACIIPTSGQAVTLGSWDNAEIYIKDILEDLNYNYTGWLDWNLVLDDNGGPNYANNFVDSPIIVAADKQTFYKQPMYYGIGHFSKFLPRGSQRIKVTDLCQNTVDNVAFLTPQNTIVTILYNEGEEITINVKLCNQVATVVLEQKSVATIEFLNQIC